MVGEHGPCQFFFFEFVYFVHTIPTSPHGINWSEVIEKLTHIAKLYRCLKPVFRPDGTYHCFSCLFGQCRSRTGCTKCEAYSLIDTVQVAETLETKATMKLQFLWWYFSLDVNFYCFNLNIRRNRRLYCWSYSGLTPL